MEKKPHHQLKQIESLFAQPFTRSTKSPEVAIIESQRDFNCDVHGGRRGSAGSVSSTKRDSIGSLHNGDSNTRGQSVPPVTIPATAAPIKPNRRGSVAPALSNIENRNARGQSVPPTIHTIITAPVKPLRRGSSVAPTSGNSTLYNGTVRLRKKESMDRDITPNRDSLGNVFRRQTESMDRDITPNGVQRRQSFAGNRLTGADSAR